MIIENTKQDLSNILHVINDAAIKYKGVIPDDCWHEPYMIEKELVNEFDNGVRMFGYNKNNKLVGVMGIQELKDVTLIRHAYTLTNYQGMGIGNHCCNTYFNSIKTHIYLLELGRMPLGQFSFMKSLALFVITKNKPLNYLKNIGKFHQNKSKIL